MMSETPPSMMNTDPLNAEMRCAILTNKSGEVVILQSAPLDKGIEWAEFHAFQNDLTLVSENGSTQHLGIDINAAMKNNLLNATQITLAHIDNDTIKSRMSVNLIISDH